MHNVSGESGGVSLTFRTSIGRYDCGPTAVMVAGYEGTFQEFPIEGLGLRQVWIADIGGSTVVIRLEAEPDTPAAMVAEAHAIIESLRREPDGDGFMLTFTLPEGWDSG